MVALLILNLLSTEQELKEMRPDNQGQDESQIKVRCGKNLSLDTKQPGLGSD